MDQLTKPSELRCRVEGIQMDRGASMQNHLEQMLHDKNMEATDLPLSVLSDITDNFSDDQQVGKGGFAVVYKGVLPNGRKVAVKKLDQKLCIDENKFNQEVGCLMRIKHKNVVRFLGYCADTQGQMCDYGGKFVMADVRQRLLCFEYHPNGSLDKYITDVSGGLEWRIRYQIIRGICAGLHYLHEKRIVHLDLKPANILLDNCMVPKITDFGLSRCFDENQSRAITSKLAGSMGYIAPESYNGVVTFKSDIYSLGVIIMEILTGKKGFSAVQNVCDSWRNRLKTSSGDILLEQVRICAEIGIQCIDANPDMRPVSFHIIEMLDDMENIHELIETGESTFSSVQHQDPDSTVLTKSILGRPSQEMDGALLLVVSKIGVTLAEETTKAVIAKLSHKVKNLKELPEKVEEIGKKLKAMSNDVKQFTTPSHTNELVRDWIGQVRDLAQHVEDVLDKYSYYALKLEEENTMTKFFSKAYYVTVFSEIADEIIQIENEIEKVVKRRDRWLQLPQFIPNPLADIERKQPQISFPEVVQAYIVGIEQNRRQVTEWLYSDKQGSTVITVWGMGGLGKTTLVANVYEREKINFNTHAWIVVSQTYDSVDLLRKMLREIGDQEHSYSQLMDLDTHDLEVKIKERLISGNCLFVLDDVRNREACTQLMDVFQNLQACRVIITTRQHRVAALAQPRHQLKLEPLEHNDACNLFCRKTFYNRMECKCPQNLEKLANAIVDRCEGLPLAIVSIGGMLSSLPATKSVWNATYDQLRGELANNGHVSAILNLSYRDTPGYLKNCFLYCGLFPEDHKFSRESLVRLWVAEGFAVAEEQSTAEEVADRYLSELIQRNMLEVVENDELGRVSTCKMHDLVRDLVLCLAKNEKYGSAYDFSSMSHMDKYVRRLSSCGWKDKIAVKAKFPHLRTLVALGIIASPSQLLSPILSESHYLTVLELQDSEITEVPASIGNLFNLRYIGLRRTGVKSLPECVEKLSNLLTLDIKQTKIEKLPRGIVKVKKLRHLLADRVVYEKQKDFQYFVGVQPPKYLSNLEELQTLETVEATNDLADQLDNLRKLRSVWIGKISTMHSAKLFAILSKLPLLSSLLLNASDENQILQLEALNPQSKQLHKLIIRGYWSAETLQCPIFQGHGKNLNYLALSWSGLQEDPLLLIAPHVPNLTYLNLNRVSSTETMVISEGSFPQLKTLILKNMLNVNQLTVGKDALRNIDGLYVVALPKLNKVPQGFESLVSLRKLWLLSLHKDFKILWELNRMRQKMPQVVEVRVE